MMPFNGPPDDNVIRPLGDDDQRLLLGLVHKYGLSSLMCALTGLGESSRASTVSATTLLSSTSAPSLVWTASDAASVHTQSTRGDGGQDMTVIHDPEMAKVHDSTWLESPCAMQSPPVQATAQGGAAVAAASPRLPMATLKKYQCPMCFLDRNLVEFGRKSDFKKHLNNFHGTDVVWICRTKACHLSFATERAYSTHAKEAHKVEALPSSAARADLCPQVVFACGFASCKDRVFEAGSRDDAPASRDKFFEHIAKHFEDDFDVNDWEYRVQLQNLMRQQRVKPVWKTCIWPKEKRQQLSWKPRSSGDLKRMLECRHLGGDISQLVRLAYILGTAPFTSSRTPPPSEIDLHFQLPFRSQCLLETADGPVKSEDASTPALAISKARPQSMFRLPSRKGRQSRTARPSTPATAASSTSPAAASAPSADPSVTGGDQTSGPHPGTPIPIPHETKLPADAPKFAPEAPPPLPKQVNSPVNNTPVNGTPVGGTPVHVHGTPMSSTPVSEEPPMYAMPMGSHQQHDAQGYPMYGVPPTSTPDAMVISPYEPPIGYPQDNPGADYGEVMYGCTPTSQASTVRPATPVPHKRPASWGRMASMEEMRPKKKPSTPHGSPYGSPFGGPEPSPMGLANGGEIPMPATMDQVPNAYGEMIPPHHPQHHQPAPTSVPGPEWALPMRMGNEPQGGYHHHQHQHHAQQNAYAQGDGMSPMTFFFDDSEGRM